MQTKREGQGGGKGKEGVVEIPEVSGVEKQK